MDYRSVLDSNLHVGDARSFTGSMHVQTTASVSQILEIWRLVIVFTYYNHDCLFSHWLLYWYHPHERQDLLM